MGKFKDLTGMKFGGLTVIKRADDYIEPKGRHRKVWQCKCECGNETLVRDDYLKSGKTQSCGCKKHKGINIKVGTKYGRLTVVKKIKNITGRSQWLCKCDCGTEINILGYRLISGGNKSCGCLRKEKDIWLGKQNIESGLMEKLSQYGRFKGTKVQLLNQKTNTRNTSGIKGVSWSTRKGKWETYIGLAGKIIKLGYFEKLEDATKARKEAEEKYFKPVIEEYENQKEGGISV